LWDQLLAELGLPPGGRSDPRSYQERLDALRHSVVGEEGQGKTDEVVRGPHWQPKCLAWTKHS
jgi:hypothetical protein